MYFFCDDSGKEDFPDNKIVAIAGYLSADVNVWQFFESRWKNILLRYGFSWMHMTDFMANQKEFSNFSKEWPVKKQVLNEFVTVIRGSQLIGFGVAVDAEAWRKIPTAITKAEGDAQEFCFTRIIRLIVDRMEIAAPHDSVAMIFDCDRSFAPARFQRFIRIRDSYPGAQKHLESFAVAEPRRYLPLQAADFLAWETGKDLERQMGGFSSRPEYLQLFDDIAGIFPEYVGEWWNEPKLQEQFVKPLTATGDYRP